MLELKKKKRLLKSLREDSEGKVDAQQYTGIYLALIKFSSTFFPLINNGKTRTILAAIQRTPKRYYFFTRVENFYISIFKAETTFILYLATSLFNFQD